MDREERFALMHRLVDSPPGDLPLRYWEPLYQLAASLRPDLVIELGRGWGNSLCVLAQAANDVGAEVVSISHDEPSGWTTRTEPRLREHLPTAWFQPLTVVQGDIVEYDFRPVLRGRKRVFLYWDAHGDDVAVKVIRNVIPRLPRENLVVVDDICDEFDSIFEEVVPIAKYLQDEQIAWQSPSDRWLSFRTPRRPLIRALATQRRRRS